MWDFLVTLFLFNVTLLLVPFFLVSYVALRASHALWLACASLLHPDVEFLKQSTIRSLLDTHRNQGIVSVLLCVKGQAQPGAVKRYLHELVRRPDKSGNLAFPRLQQLLVTRCGSYGWKQAVFDLDQNVISAPVTFKGRGITAYNIQEYVSQYVSKYLPPNLPPWQIVIIPSSEDHHYILFKIHHVLLSEGLNIGDLLPLIPPTRQVMGSPIAKSPLIDVFKKPQALPLLKQRLTEDLTNSWNEFISNYDPLERTELLKNTPTILEFYAIMLITAISIIKECRKGFRVIKSDALSRLRYTLMTVNNETAKRQVSAWNFFKSILATLDPRHLAKIFFKGAWYLLATVSIRLPITLCKEVQALSACITLHYCPYPKTFVGILFNYVPLLYGSTKEIAYFLRILFNAPKTVLQDILLQKETLQTVTLCGRKSVAWSEPVKFDTIRAIAKSAGVSETEIMLSATSYTISRFLSAIKHDIPEDLPVTVRNVNSNYIFATGTNVKPGDSVSGLLCLNLPIFSADASANLMENLFRIGKNFSSAVEKQGLSHLLTLLQTKFGILTKFMPQTAVSVYLKYLSRKYALSVTEVSSRYPNVRQRTLWGQEVYSVIFWTPPQANTSISLCLNEYADHVKLDVMCDSQLAPHHPILARGFSEYIQQLAKITGVEHQQQLQQHILQQQALIEQQRLHRQHQAQLEHQKYEEQQLDEQQFLRGQRHLQDQDEFLKQKRHLLRQEDEEFVKRQRQLLRGEEDFVKQKRQLFEEEEEEFTKQQRESVLGGDEEFAKQKRQPLQAGEDFGIDEEEDLEEEFEEGAKALFTEDLEKHHHD